MRNRKGKTPVRVRSMRNRKGKTPVRVRSMRNRKGKTPRKAPVLARAAKDCG